MRVDRRAPAVATAAVAVAVLAVAAAAAAPPVAIAPLDRFAGTWYQLAAYGDWGQAGCLSDTTLRISPKAGADADIESRCRIVSGTAVRRGRLRAAGEDGAWRSRFAPSMLGWLPVVWSDFWVLGHDEELTWVLVGGHEYQRLAVYARTIALDEAAMAQALAAARTAGFDVERLARTRHDPTSWRNTPSPPAGDPRRAARDPTRPASAAHALVAFELVERFRPVVLQQA